MAQEPPLRLGFLIHDVSRLRRNIADKALKPVGLTRSQSWVLAHLSRNHGAGMMQTELAKLMEVGKVTLGGLIDRLEENGYVERRPDPADRRVKRIHMTRKGEKLVKQMQGIIRKMNREIMRGIDQDKVLAAEEVLLQMKHRLIDMEAVPGRRK